MPNYDVTFADVTHTEILNFWIPQFFYAVFERTIQGKMKVEKSLPVSQIWAEIWQFEFA